MAIIGDYSITRPPEVSKRRHGQWMRQILKETLQNHWRVTMGKHFKELPETQAGGPYGYSKRQPVYTELKRRRFGHKRPNERTGRLKRMIGSASRVTGTQHVARLRMKAPFPLTAQRREELEAITPEEIDEMGVLVLDRYEEELSKFRSERKRVRIT